LLVKNLPPVQRRVLLFIERTYIEQGLPPSVQEICDELGASSTNTAHGHLTALLSKGWLRRATSAKGSRGWVPVRVLRTMDAQKPPRRFQPITVVLPLRIHSNANKREHWTKRAARTKAEKRTTAFLLPDKPPALPVKVTFTRIAARPLDTDNLSGGFKACRDAVAEWLGADDKPGSGITWAYEQARPTTPKTYAAQILIEPGEEG
jgi:hypothetical protein